MVVAKRQRREKATKVEQRNLRVPEREPQEKKKALLASTIYIWQVQGEEEKKKKEEPILSLVLFSSLLLGRPTLMLEDVFSFAYQIKLNCN